MLAEVSPGIFLCGPAESITDEDKKLVKAHQICHALALSGESKADVRARLCNLFSNGIDLDKLAVIHMAMDQTLFVGNPLSLAINYIAKKEANGQPLLVHSQSGVSRCVTSVCAYLMRKNKWSVDDALAHIRKSFPTEGPCEKHILQLKLFEQAGFVADFIVIARLPGHKELLAKLDALRKEKEEQFKRIDRVADGLYLSGVQPLKTPEGKAQMRNLGIKRVLSLLSGPAFVEQQQLGRENIEHKLIQINDSHEQDLLGSDLLSAAITFIAEAEAQGHAILVHCRAGISRSVTCICAHLMAKHKWSADKAIHYVKKRRSCASPNDSFLAQLRLFEKFGSAAFSSASIAESPFYEEFEQSLKRYGIKLPPPTSSPKMQDEVAVSGHADGPAKEIAISFDNSDSLTVNYSDT